MYELKILTLSVCPHQEGLKNMPDHGGIFFKPSQCGYTLRVTSHKHLIHLSTLHQHSKYQDTYEEI